VPRTIPFFLGERFFRLENLKSIRNLGNE